MIKMIYYLDTCIWLNLFKKEGDNTKGIPYWKLAEKLIQELDAKKEIIIVSTIVLKELTFKLEEKFDLAKQFFKETKFIQIIKTRDNDLITFAKNKVMVFKPEELIS